MDVPGQSGGPRLSQVRVVFGLVVMLAGALLLIDRLDWWGVRLPGLEHVPLWPWVLVALGLARLSDRSVNANGCLRGRRSGAWLLFVGLWGLLTEYRLFGFHYGHSWPILLIGAGALLVWRAVEQTTGAPAQREP